MMQREEKKPLQLGPSSNDSEVVVDPRRFGGLASLRQTQLDARRARRETKVLGENGVRVRFRARCPWCHASNIVMSDADPGQFAVCAPSRGDAIQCGNCRRHHIVEQVTFLDVKTHPIELPADG